MYSLKSKDARDDRYIGGPFQRLSAELSERCNMMSPTAL